MDHRDLGQSTCLAGMVVCILSIANGKFSIILVHSGQTHSGPGYSRDLADSIQVLSMYAGGRIFTDV